MRTSRPSGTPRSPHLREIDIEAGALLAVRRLDPQHESGVAGEVLGRKPVAAASEVPSALLAHRRPLVLGERGLDHAVAHDQPRREETRKILRVPAQLDPEHHALAQLLQHPLLVLNLQRLALEGGLPRRQRETVEGRHDAHALSAAVHDTPLGAEGLAGDRPLSRAKRFLAILVTERQRGGARGRAPHGEDETERGETPWCHGVGPATTTRLNVEGERNFPATRCTSAAVTRAMRSRYRSA